MSIGNWVVLLILGGILGMIGQGLRVIPGLKKVHEEANLKQKEFKQLFQASRLISSLLIGFVAGAIASVLAVKITDIDKVQSETLVTLIGIGYAGTDFIEGLTKKPTRGLG